MVNKDLQNYENPSIFVKVAAKNQWHLFFWTRCRRQGHAWHPPQRQMEKFFKFRNERFLVFLSLGTPMHSSSVVDNLLPARCSSYYNTYLLTYVYVTTFTYLLSQHTASLISTKRHPLHSDE